MHQASRSLPCLLPADALPDSAFPPVGHLGLTSPPSSVRCAATTAALPLSGDFACRSPPRYRACFRRSWCPTRARALEEAPGTPGPGVTRSPIPGMQQGDRWLSHVPESPLCRPAPLSDPSGVLRTRQSAPRTAAFQSLATVGFPLYPQLYTLRGSITRPAFSLHPAPYGPLRGGTRVRS